MRLTPALAIAFALVLQPEGAAADVALPAPGSEGWRPVRFASISRHTRYEVVEVGQLGGIAAFRASSECGASAQALRLDEVDLAGTPRLTWRWKIERGLDIEDELAKRGDDFAARVSVVFRLDQNRLTGWQRMKRAMGAMLYGEELPSHAITYVWTSRIAPGRTWPNPFNEHAHMVAQRNDPPSQIWHQESVDVRADYARILGPEPAPLLALAVMSDSDNSCQATTAYFADFRFLGPAEDATGSEAAE